MIGDRLQFVVLAVGAAAAALLAMVLADVFHPLRFYAVALGAFVLLVELTAPVGVSPPWRRRVRLCTAVLVAGFVVLAALRLWQIVVAVS